MMKRTILLLLAALCCALTAAAQDLIVKTDAAKIEAKVIEITPEAVRYKRFSNPDGPTYVLPVAQIHYIQYANGEKEYYTKTIPDAADSGHPDCSSHPGHSGCPGSAGRAACFRRPVRAQTVRNRRTLRPERHPGSDLPAFGRPPARTGRIAR